MTHHWPVDTDLLPDTDPTRQVEAINAAITVLWALTGRRFGTRTVVARPCPRQEETPAAWWGPWVVPVLDGGVWRDIPCQATTPCSRTGPAVVLLPGPVHEVTGVAVDGQRVDDDTWALEGDWLYRADGTPWPGQDMTLAAGAEGTWSVTYQKGTPPPAGAATAVGRLAAEFLLSITHPDKCALPRHTRQIVRQGVTVQMADPTDIITAGGTGLPEVDMWVRALNPHQHAAPPVVWSPDTAVH